MHVRIAINFNVTYTVAQPIDLPLSSISKCRYMCIQIKHFGRKKKNTTKTANAINENYTNAAEPHWKCWMTKMSYMVYGYNLLRLKWKFTQFPRVFLSSDDRIYYCVSKKNDVFGFFFHLKWRVNRMQFSSCIEFNWIELK